MGAIDTILIIGFAATVFWINVLYRRRRANMTKEELASQETEDYKASLW